MVRRGGGGRLKSHVCPQAFIRQLIAAANAVGNCRECFLATSSFIANPSPSDESLAFNIFTLIRYKV